MRRRLAAAAFLLLVFTGAPGTVIACGDKFLVTARGTRFKRASAPRRPAAILIWADPASNLARGLVNVPVEATLEKAGYRPTSVARVEDFDRALEQGPWDLVLVDGAEGLAVLGRLKGDPEPVVVPVLYKPTRAELRQAKRTYPVVLEAPARSQAFLETIDEALALAPQPAPVAGKAAS